MSIKISELERLKIKCAHLELSLIQERAQHELKLANMERDKVIKEIFDGYIPNAKLSDYTFDMETGVFDLARPPAEEEVPVTVPEPVPEVVNN